MELDDNLSIVISIGLITLFLGILGVNCLKMDGANTKAMIEMRSECVKAGNTPAECSQL